ncbi:MAG: outer membrane beta-barrel protein, partial [Elusimicrobiota bacterium]
GPSFGFLLSAKDKYSGSDLDNFKAQMESIGIEIEDESDVKDSMKSFDAGIALGGGIGIEAGEGTFLLDARYTMGLTSFDDSGADLDQKNAVISITAGYTF